VRARLLIAVVTLSQAGPLGAQNLGEAAAREKERREKQGRPAVEAPAFTDEDLVKLRGPEAPPKPSPSPGAPGSKPSPAARSTPPPPAPSGPPTPDPEAAIRAQLEASWRGRARAQREAVARAEARIQDLEGRLAGLRNDLSPSGLQDPTRQQTREADTARLRGELDEARQQLARAKQGIEDLEEQARRQRVPPGWLREP
jgi:hypothetical protein